jgi:hypothetical protein
MHLNIDYRVVKKGHESRQHAGVSCWQIPKYRIVLRFLSDWDVQKDCQGRNHGYWNSFLFKAPFFQNPKKYQQYNIN